MQVWLSCYTTGRRWFCSYEKMNAVAFRSHSIQLAPMKMDQANFNAKSVSFLSQSLSRDRAGTGNVSFCVTHGSVPSVSSSPKRKTGPWTRRPRITRTRGNSLRDKLLSLSPHPCSPRPGRSLVFVHCASDQRIQTINCAWEPLSHFSRFTIMFTYLIKRDAILNLLSFFQPWAKPASLFIPREVKANCQQL